MATKTLTTSYLAHLTQTQAAAVTTTSLAATTIRPKHPSGKISSMW